MPLTRTPPRWLMPASVCIVAFVAGYLTFAPARKSISSSLQPAVRAIQTESPDQPTSSERVERLRDLSSQPAGLARDHDLYKAVQSLQPADFPAAIENARSQGADSSAFPFVFPGGQMAMTFAPHTNRIDALLFGPTTNRIDALLFGPTPMPSPIVEACMERWMDVDADGALRWVTAAWSTVDPEAAPPLAIREINALCKVIAKRRPEWILEKTIGLADEDTRNSALCTILTEVASREPQRAREWIKKVAEGERQQELLTAYIEGAAVSDPSGALEVIQSLDEPRGHFDLIKRLVDEVSHRAPSRLSEVLGKLDGPQRAIMTWNALAGIAGQPSLDPFAWIQAQCAADPEVNNAATQNCPTDGIGKLVERDGRRTMDWLASLPPSDRGDFKVWALMSWSASDPVAAIDWLAEHPLKIKSWENPLFAEFSRQAPERFVQWVDTLPEGDQRNSAQFAMADMLALQGRTNEALDALPAKIPNENMARAAAAKLASADPLAVGQWVATLPAGSTQSMAALGLVETWVQRSPQDAARWIETLPPGGARDAGSEALATALAPNEPDSAALWLGQIQNAQARYDAVARSFSNLSEVDPPAARAWLKSLACLSGTEKTRILSRRE
jgi:hypothetical protein